MAAFVTFVIVFVLFQVIASWFYSRHLRRLAADRPSESICQFARSLPYRQLDTSIMRDVYESVQDWIGKIDGRHLPIRAADRFVETFHMDPQDLEDMAIDVARRRGRTLDNCEANPYYQSVHNVGDLVHFLCAQPRQSASS